MSAPLKWLHSAFLIPCIISQTILGDDVLSQDVNGTTNQLATLWTTVSDRLWHLRTPMASLAYDYRFDMLRINNRDSRVWDVVIATCDEKGAGTDASVYLKVYYETAHDYETFNLDNPGRDDFERGARDHFKLMLKQSDIINMGLFWWPGFTFSQPWCAKWVLLLNSDTETCFEGIFNKWILHYKDPPTYATKFHRLRFADCVSPGELNAHRRSYLRYEDTQGLN